MKRLLIISLFFLLAPHAFAATTGSFTGGYKSCYQYGVDNPPYTINFSGGSTQDQVQVEFTSGYTPNGGQLRFVTGNTTSPDTGSLVWSSAFDGVTARPWQAFRVRYYSSGDGFSGYDTVSFVVQDGPCVAAAKPNRGITTFFGWW